MKRFVFMILMSLIVAPCALAQTAPPAQYAGGSQNAAPAPKASSTFGKTQLFQIVILTATVDGPEELKGLPKNAEKAIRDIRDFLPYKSYVMVDSALLRMTSDSSVSQTTLTGKIESSTISFHLGMSYREREGRLAVDRFELVRLDPKPHTTLETSFGITRGETVVVGTSKLNGEGRALVVLVTAVPTS